MDKILINRAKFVVNLGVVSEERNRQQILYANITTYADTRKAGKSDDIKDSLNYADIHRYARIAAESKPWSTLEAVAEAIFRQLQLNLKFEKVTIHLEKPGAMAHKNVEWAGIEITRSWEEASSESLS